MTFSSNFDSRKVNPLINIKFQRQACLPMLLYGAEDSTLTLDLFKLPSEKRHELTEIRQCE